MELRYPDDMPLEATGCPCPIIGGLYQHLIFPDTFLLVVEQHSGSVFTCLWTSVGRDPIICYLHASSIHQHSTLVTDFG